MPHDAWLLNLPQTDYAAALNLQHDCAAARYDGRLERDLMILLEHPPVFTLGRRGGRDNLLVTEDQLNHKGIHIVPIERGGDITYHGPGQLVAYPIINLRAPRMGVVDLVTHLETAMARTAGHWGIRANGNKAFRGAWVGSRKLGSIGITVRRGVSFHGLALNVNNDLTPFEWINPCGIHGCTMTSLSVETGKALDMDAVRRQMVRHLGDLLERSFSEIDYHDLTDRVR
jgi:lipoate-protein ligase B